tara:strand:- start:82 stop:882 length:801 start_codon:yes stop_codon:yes gene_type:complete
METLRLIHNLPKTGGTIISKCLGAQKNVTLLSEIHPKGQEIRDKMNANSLIADPIYQAYKWNNLMTDKEYKIFKDNNKDFKSKIDFIIEKALSSNKYLVIRDWSFVDFFGKPFIEPTYKNMLIEILKKKFEIQNVFILRNPIETLISCYKNLPFFKYNYDLNFFLNSYRSFFLTASKGKIFKYEDFINRPDDILKQMCEILKIEYSIEYTKNMKNIMLTGNKRGIESNEIFKKDTEADKVMNKQQKDNLKNNKLYTKLMKELSNYY